MTSRALPGRALLALLALTLPVMVSPASPARPDRARAGLGTRVLWLSPEDTSLNADRTNYSGDTLLGAYTWPDHEAASAILLKFDLAALPAGAVVEQATLHLALVGSDAQPESAYAVTAHKVLARTVVAEATGHARDRATAWSPRACCAVGAPLARADAGGAQARQAIDKTPGFKAWKLTGMVQEWQADPSTNFGVLLQPDASTLADRYRVFASMEHPDAALRPALRIEYTEAASTLTLAPQDTYLSINTTNHAGAAQLGTYTWPDQRVANAILMKFNLAGVPAGAIIQQATLHLALVQSDTQPEPTYTITAHKVIGKNPDPARATGYTVDGTNGWTPNACCHDGAPLAQADLSPPYDTRDIDKAAGFKVWTVTRIVQEWLADPASNFGVVLNADASKPRDRYRYFASMEHADTTVRPFLRVTYALPANSALLAPEDTYLNLDAINYSAQTRLAVYTWPHQLVANAILLKFDLSSLPPGATIDEAMLHLSLADSDAKPERTYRVGAHKLVGRNAVVAAATGHRADSLTPWTPNDCCYHGVPLAQADISAPYDVREIDQTRGYKVWTVTPIVRDWLASPSTNYGLVLNPDIVRVPVRGRQSDTRDRYRWFASMEEPNSGLRPFLRVAYTVPTTPDTTPPSVSVTAPAGGATVSGTVTVTASASDNVGVAGVQFKRNGANLGGEDTAAPWSVSWDTTAAANGSHTLTAVARDAAGNQTTSAGVTVTVSNGATAGIAALYPGDAGIEAHPDVVFVERFEEAVLSSVFARWTDILNGVRMLSSLDVPAGSPGTRSLNIPWIGGGVSDGGHLYKQLTPGVDQTLHVRYYIKYPTSGSYNHTGIWMGGYNPPLAWPNPQAGTRPAGNDRFMAAAEQNTLTTGFDHYDYWMNMRQSGDGNYWGNVLLNNPNVDARAGQWTCVEHMVKLNNPTTASNGEHAIWLDGVKVSHLGPGFPNGTWSGGIFTQGPGGAPFEGFRWRSDANLKLNWIWLQNYAPGDPAGFTGTLLFDHVVAARSYIGCLAPAGAPDTTPPAVSLTAPAAGATVSGSAVTVSATASDNVGVTGVQFKLDGANLGAEDSAPPWSVAWNTAGAANGSHTLAAVARDAAGNITTSPGIAVTVTNPVGGAWPNEPAGFRTINDQPWDALTGNGWNYLRRTSSQDASIVTDAGAPHSPVNELRMVFTPSMSRDSEPSVHWIGLSPRPREIYTGWWLKLSSNWTPSPAGGGKITFLWAPDGAGQVYSNVGGSSAPHRININTEWAPYGQNFWEPNVTRTDIHYNQWYRIEWYVKYESSAGAGDGIMRWWVNGVLNGDHRNVRFPACCFQQFEFAPTLQNPPPATQYMYVDHVHVSTP